MSKKVTQKSEVSPQKFRWNTKKKFDNYESANKLKEDLVNEGLRVKIRRCGPGGINFKVIVGTPVKTNKNSNKKESKNAN